MQGGGLRCEVLTICQNAGGGAAGLTGARANGMTLSATGGRATAADAKKAGIATHGKWRKREERRSYVGRDGTRTSADNEKRGAFAPSRQIFDKTWGCFGGTGKVVGRKRGEMDKTWDVLTKKRGKNAQNGGVLGHRKVVLNYPRAVGEKRRAERVRRGREFTIKPGERHKKSPFSRENGEEGERRCGERRVECTVN